ncbi:hypothetical protein [Streptomyces sp. NPDC002573]|uniref:hypothetical protein n=1 Tax=Streptomyces sp. NPDC002573 TaxID=3364651 RepID=UPI0036851BE5
MRALSPRTGRDAGAATRRDPLTGRAVDGWVDAIPAPGPRGTATFDLIVRPADADTVAPDAPDTVVSCISGDPRITRELLNGLQPGDLLRVTGTLVQSQAPGSNASNRSYSRYRQANGMGHP